MSLPFRLRLSALTLAFAASAAWPLAASPQHDMGVRPSDAALRDRIDYRLDTSSSVRRYDLSVNVSDRDARLSGEVATRAQKAEAGRLANVPGVGHVTNDIVVTPKADRTVTERTKAGLSKTGDKIDDAWITTKVKWFFMGEDTLKDSDINVDTHDNVVTLHGSVRGRAGKARAAELARQTEGVRRVVNDLTIGSR